MSHAQILRHSLLRALRRQGGQCHCDKLQRHAEKQQHQSDGKHPRSRIGRTIRQRTAPLAMLAYGSVKRKTEKYVQSNSSQLCCRHAAKTENSEYEKRRRLHFQSSPLRFEALIFGLPLKAERALIRAICTPAPMCVWLTAEKGVDLRRKGCERGDPVYLKVHGRPRDVLLGAKMRPYTHD